MGIVAAAQGQLVAQPVYTFSLDEHARIRAGHAREGKHTGDRGYDEHVHVAHGNADTLNCAVFPACDVDDVALAHDAELS